MSESKSFPIFSMINDFESKSFHYPDIKAQHRSLYYFLLSVLMHRRGANKMPVAYDYGMAGSKIGNHKTYTNTLRDLEKHKFLTYTAGKNRFTTPIIDMHFCKPTANLLQAYCLSSGVSTANNIKDIDNKDDVNSIATTLEVDDTINSIPDNNLTPVLGLTSEQKYQKFLTVFNDLTKTEWIGDSESRKNLELLAKAKFTITHFETAIKNALKDQWIKDHPNALTPKFITTSEHFQRYLNYRDPEPDFIDKGCGRVVRTQEEIHNLYGGLNPNFTQPEDWTKLPGYLKAS